MPVPQTAPAERTLIRDRVADTIRSAILDGTLEAGERLHDDQLIAWLGASRTPIREALAHLADEGLVEMAANRYTRVALPDPEEVLDALHTLGILFGGIIRVTVPVMTDRDVTRTVVRLDSELERLREGGTARVVLTLDGAYNAWLRLCPNQILVDTVSRVISGLAFKLRVDSVGELIPSEHLIELYPVFRDAIIERDPVAAELAIEAIHMVDRTAKTID
ncbi:DNA-binding GntR family transcriptional regulator [Curtobacterium luteum]|uniref:DNA-binding GntR family transcriptional regulator n=1 Tax=Curtobacterium luteum TaxID=33881 RepID=A0A8H9G9Y2_9MICO|nr:MULTISPECIES: GntR family transcriptional regulator [Curtobacterium]MBM7800966.1 DNA-binding GntR family transcriptional regulator [Curtobacterium luteum]NUU49403.1 GntR family transcriptional regulator [Curtobacterium luteum]GGL06453.1 hypothetical protein GCM10009769_25890 [Curtobacterium luteum]